MIRRRFFSAALHEKTVVAVQECGKYLDFDFRRTLISAQQHARRLAKCSEEPEGKFSRQKLTRRHLVDAIILSTRPAIYGSMIAQQAADFHDTRDDDDDGATCSRSPLSSLSGAP